MARELGTHRDLLENLYITQNLKMQEVIAFMRSEHSIAAGKQTYERLFRQWGLNKNNKGDNWRWVDHKMRKRQAQGRASAVYINQERIPMSTVQKEISRHVKTLQQIYLSAKVASSPRTPAGYCIETPASTASVHVSTPEETTMGPPPKSQSQGPVNDGSDLLGNTDTTVIEAPSQINESHLPEDNLYDVDLRDKTMIVETLQSCGAFIKSWGSSGRSMSRKKLLQLYDTIAHGILVAAQTPEGKSAPIEATFFETGFNILLATYRSDIKSANSSVIHANKSEYEDVFRTALFMAASKGVVDLVRVLLGAFGQRDPKNNHGQTCLHVASIQNHPEVVEYLLERDVDVNARSQDGRTPWTSIGHLASHEDVSKLLIRAGARINDTRPGDLMNVLYQEAAGGHLEPVRTLIRRGVDPSFTTPCDWAPLHFAKSVEIVQILVEAGAKVNAVSDTGKTPLDIHFNNQAKKEYLVARGAKTAKELQLARSQPEPLGLELLMPTSSRSSLVYHEGGVIQDGPRMSLSPRQQSYTSPSISLASFRTAFYQDPHQIRENTVTTSLSWSSTMM